METTVESIEFCGEHAVMARTTDLEMVLVPAWGSNLVSLTCRRTGVELLRKPESAEQFWEMPFLYGIPVLFPPNRIEDGVFTFEDKTYRFNLNEPETHNHSHGLLFEEPWELVETKQANGQVEIVTEFDAAKHPEALKQFPHHFVVRMSFKLEGSTLHKTASVINKSDSAFPWGLGYHTTFNFPFRPGDPVENCTFTLTANRQWTLNERFLPTGEIVDIGYRQALNEGLDLSAYSLDDVFLSSVVDGGMKNETVLHDRNVGIKLVYCCDDSFKHWVVYNDDGKQGYVCPEPYTWVTNAPNLPMDAELTGVQILQPGEEKQAYSTILVSYE
ncbi:aldose 1-epimerase [Paenibacillus mendelii]|uniref:Aldose 1-epimerase n=1 Tax=Paenibacillus mendelii TaxID=206163 RepID=A0ABV6JFS8_9BACL|nr:aldose 1-epimerase [Paenibacillus mendelii]MCQ6557644.1 aldose 1-epimerase [Paenibacillus mendelii]